MSCLSSSWEIFLARQWWQKPLVLALGRQAETLRSLSTKPVWSTEWVQDIQGFTEKPSLEKHRERRHQILKKTNQKAMPFTTHTHTHPWIAIPLKQKKKTQALLVSSNCPILLWYPAQSLLTCEPFVFRPLCRVNGCLQTEVFGASVTCLSSWGWCFLMWRGMCAHMGACAWTSACTWEFLMLSFHTFQWRYEHEVE